MVLSSWLRSLLQPSTNSTTSECQESGNSTQLVLKYRGSHHLLVDGSRDWVIVTTSWTTGSLASSKQGHLPSGWLASTILKDSWLLSCKKSPVCTLSRSGLSNKSSPSSLLRRTSFKVMTAVLRNNSRQSLKELSFMDSTLKVPNGPSKDSALRNRLAKICTSNSQSCTLLLNLQQYRLTKETQELEGRTIRQMLRKPTTSARSTNTQKETTSTSSPEYTYAPRLLSQLIPRRVKMTHLEWSQRKTGHWRESHFSAPKNERRK